MRKPPGFASRGPAGGDEKSLLFGHEKSPSFSGASTQRGPLAGDGGRANPTASPTKRRLKGMSAGTQRHACPDPEVGRYTTAVERSAGDAQETVKTLRAGRPGSRIGQDLPLRADERSAPREENLGCPKLNSHPEGPGLLVVQAGTSNWPRAVGRPKLTSSFPELVRTTAVTPFFRTTIFELENYGTCSVGPGITRCWS